MSKDKIIISLTVSIICMTLAFVMTVQLRTVSQTDITSIENMREDELNQQADIWKTRYEEIQEKIDEDNQKINEYKQKAQNNQETSGLLTNELTQMRTTLGTTNIEGEGIVITLKDGEKQITSEDLIKLINELKLAGAEAISVNNQRIINLTEIVDVNSYILINGQRETSPFEIKVIGNSKYLISGISSRGGYSDTIKNDEKEISISEEKNIKINKYSEELKLKTIKID